MSTPPSSAVTPPAEDSAFAAALSLPTAPIREDQVQNAVTFLTHPKVRGSSAATKRSFLERKGLTPAEVDEAFSRAGDDSTALPSAFEPSAPALAPAHQHAPIAAAPRPQLQQPVQNTAGVLAQTPLALPPQPVRWTQVVLGIGVLGSVAYALHAYVVPRLMRALRSWQEAAEAREARAQQREEALLAALQALQTGQAEVAAAAAKLLEGAKQLNEQAAATAAQRADSEVPEALRALRRELAEIRTALLASGPLLGLGAAPLGADLGPRGAPGQYGSGASYGAGYGHGHGRVGPAGGRYGRDGSYASLGDAAVGQGPSEAGRDGRRGGPGAAGWASTYEEDYHDAVALQPSLINSFGGGQYSGQYNGGGKGQQYGAGGGARGQYGNGSTSSGPADGYWGRDADPGNGQRPSTPPFSGSNGGAGPNNSQQQPRTAPEGAWRSSPQQLQAEAGHPGAARSHVHAVSD